MNMDIVTSGVRLEERIVNCGEPSEQLVYKAVFGKMPQPNLNLIGLRAAIEELSEERWELLSLEYGKKHDFAAYWLCSSYITETPVEELRHELRRTLRYLRIECIKLNLAPAA